MTKPRQEGWPARGGRVKGIRCPTCHGQTKVLETRPRTFGVYRRHKCLKCGEKFTTHERPKREAA